MSGFFFSSRRRHTRCSRDWSSDVCSSDLLPGEGNCKPLLRSLRARLRRAEKRRRSGEAGAAAARFRRIDRKSTRLNSSHGYISYAVFCLKKKKQKKHRDILTPARTIYEIK